MSKKSSPFKQVLVLHHTHTDIGYTHPQPILWELQRRFIDQSIDLCEQTADWPEESRLRWTCEVTGTLEYWLNHTSSKQVDRFRNLVKIGQISAGAQFVNGTPLSNAEQLARSFRPMAQLRRELGLPLTVAVNHDINGLPWPAAQLLLDSGVKMLVMGINFHFGGYPLKRPMAFNWQAPDGRQLLTWNGEHYGLFNNVLVGRPGLHSVGTTDLMAESLGRHFDYLTANGYPYDFVVMTGTHVHHVDNNPPYLKLAEMIRRWNQENRQPTIRFITLEDLLAKIKQLPSESIPTYSGDWTDYWNFGSASSALDTKVNRHAVRRLIAAQYVNALSPADNKDIQKRYHEAWWNALLYDEHTWGINSTLNSAPEEEAEQRAHKAGYAYQTRSLSALLLRDELENLADNPTDAEKSQGLLLVNPAPVPRRAVVKIPAALSDGSWQHFSSNIHRLDSYLARLKDSDATYLGPVDIPANGYCRLPLNDVPKPVENNDLKIGNHFIESPFHRLDFDPSTGQITALMDKQSQWQMIDKTSLWPFFGFVHETLDETKLTDDLRGEGGRDAFCDRASRDPDPLVPAKTPWHKSWPAKRQGPESLLSLCTEYSHGGATLCRKFKAPGVAVLKQRITLFAHRPAIEMTATLQKKEDRNPEAIYFAFPMNMNQWQAHFDTADIPVELDREQLPGACRDWLTAGQWVDLSDAQHGMTLACPDAPLVQIGGFNFGKQQDAIPRERNPLMLSWVMNNYWPTNFPLSQPGRVSFHYELTTHGPYNPVEAMQAGFEAAWPVEVHPIISCDKSYKGQFLNVSGDGVFPLGLKKAEDGKGLILRLVNGRNEASPAKIKIPGKTVQSAWLCNPLEQNQNSLTVQERAAELTIAQRSIATVRILPKTQ